MKRFTVMMSGHDDRRDIEILALLDKLAELIEERTHPASRDTLGLRRPFGSHYRSVTHHRMGLTITELTDGIQEADKIQQGIVDILCGVDPVDGSYPSPERQAVLIMQALGLEPQ